MKFKKLTALLLLLLMLAGCGSGSDIPQESGSEPEDSTQTAAGREEPLDVRLACDSGDSLNPYACSTQQNLLLSSLLYDPLIALSPSLEVEPRIASEIIVNGSVCSVTLRDDALFSDGTRVTAQDVVYSLQLARSGRYSAQLDGIVSAEAVSDGSLLITLSSEDAYFDHSLCIPVVKSGTGTGSLPTGCGRFLISESYDDGGMLLLPNPDYYDPIENISSVKLIPLSGSNEQNSAVMFGSIDLIYSDLRDSSDPGVSTGIRQVSLSNLVYFGVNNVNLGFTSQQLAALNLCIPRNYIADTVYSGYAAAVTTPLDPSWTGVGASVAGAPTAEALGLLLDEAGFDTLDSEGYRTRGGYRMSLTIAVCSDSPMHLAAATAAAKAYRQVGIRTDLSQLSSEEYRYAVASGAYDLYVGETRLTPNFDLSGLLLANETFGTGTGYNAGLWADYLFFKSGELTGDQFNTAFEESPVFFPAVFRRGAVCFFRDFSANIIATSYDLFYNIGEW